MASLLAFPLGMPLGGNRVSDLRAIPLGGRGWRLDWTPIVVGWDSAYIVTMDGEHLAVVPDGPPIDLRSEAAVGVYSPSPIIEVVQIPRTLCDPGYHVSGYFSTLQPNKLKVTWGPPASVADVEKYRVYWDKGEGAVQYTSAYLMVEMEETGASAYEAWTPALSSGTYRFVVRTVDAAGNESTNTTATSQSLTTLPGIVTNLAYHLGLESSSTATSLSSSSSTSSETSASTATTETTSATSASTLTTSSSTATTATSATTESTSLSSSSTSSMSSSSTSTSSGD